MALTILKIGGSRNRCRDDHSIAVDKGEKPRIRRKPIVLPT